MSIKVCIPTNNDKSVPMEQKLRYCQSGLQELEKCTHTKFVITTLPNSCRNWARNRLISNSDLKLQKMTDGHSHKLTLDDDIGFTLKDAERLLSHKKPICCAPYTLHSNPYIYDCGGFVKGCPGDIAYRYSTKEKGLKIIDWAGLGFWFIENSVFEQLEHPWYRHMIVDTGDRAMESSDSIGFCMYLKKCGFDIWCDFDIKLSHRGVFPKTMKG